MKLFKLTQNFLTNPLPIFSLLALSAQLTAGNFSYPDFDTAMLREEISPSSKVTGAQRNARYKLANEQLVKMFKEIYYRNIQAAESDLDHGSYRIPPIVHQIWLGSEVPEKYHEWMASWMKHLGWEYKLWIDEDVKRLKLYNQELYDASTNYGEKSDILRLEILNLHGGIYVDTDYECFNPEVLEELHKSFDFYIGFEPIEHGFTQKFNMFKFCNAVIASAPGHPLIVDLIHNLKANYYAYRKHCGPVERTGPSYLTRIICKYEQSHAHHHRNMYLPSTFIYPFTEPDLNYFINNPSEEVFIAPETIGIHYWSGSWRKKPPSCSETKQPCYDVDNFYEGVNYFYENLERGYDKMGQY